MSGFIAALPMYDWRERQAEVDAEWAALRDGLRAVGVEAPERLTRRNGDLPQVPGGIRDARGEVIAPDPATLPPDDFDLFTLWRHPRLLLSQTCWGPIESGLAPYVEVLHQPDYSEHEGGQGEHYSSAILMRASDAPPAVAGLPELSRIRGLRLAFNNPDSMSGLIGLQRDLEAAGEGLDVFAERIESGSHRSSIAAVVEGRADLCAVDCRSWSLARRFEPLATKLRVVGWTGRRKGLPYVASASLEPELLALLRQVVGSLATPSAADRADRRTAVPVRSP